MLDTYSDLMTVTEVADVLHVGKNTVYNLLTSGDIKAFRIGTKWKIPKLSIEEYILSQSHLHL